MKFLKNYSLPILIFGCAIYVIAMVITLPKPLPQQANTPPEQEGEAPAQEQEGMRASEISSTFSNENEGASIDAAVDAIKIPPPIEGKEPVNYNQPQILPSEPLKIMLAEGTEVNLNVEIAKAPKELMTGMMYRNNVPQNTGMLFLFDEEKAQSFWMKNTFVPLDIIFITKDGVILNIHPNAVPGDFSPLKSKGDIVAVLEIGGGEAEKLGIKAGDTLENISLKEFQNTFFQVE